MLQSPQPLTERLREAAVSPASSPDRRDAGSPHEDTGPRDGPGPGRRLRVRNPAGPGSARPDSHHRPVVGGAWRSSHRERLGEPAEHPLLRLRGARGPRRDRHLPAIARGALDCRRGRAKLDVHPSHGREVPQRRHARRPGRRRQPAPGTGPGDRRRLRNPGRAGHLPGNGRDRRARRLDGPDRHGRTHGGSPRPAGGHPHRARTGAGRAPAQVRGHRALQDHRARRVARRPRHPRALLGAAARLPRGPVRRGTGCRQAR